MKKVCLLLVMSLLLGLTACNGDKENGISEPVKSESEGLPQGEESFTLNEQGRAFLTRMCRILKDFDSRTTKDEAFWRDFLFLSYTDAAEGVRTEQIYREDLGFDETVVKVSRQEAEAFAKLVYGVEMPDIQPSFEEMEEGQTSCYYQDGYYYIGVSDFPDFQYTFAEYEEADHAVAVRYTIDFEGERNVGTVCFTLEPERNDNGFIISSKVTELHD